MTAPSTEAPPLVRLAAGDATAGKLVFAQVREDPLVDLAAVEPHRRSHVVAVTSGGCTALTLLAHGAERVSAVDVNATQNHLAELKAAAAAALDHPDVLRLLGGADATAAERVRLYRAVRPWLRPATAAFWDGEERRLGAGVLRVGTTERFFRLFVPLLEHGVLRRGAVPALLACTTVDEQRRVFDDLWDTRRWRAMFPLLLNRFTCGRVYRTFFANVDGDDFATLLRRSFEHALCDVPVGENWYAHDLLEGRYRPNCLPPYLRADATAVIADRRARLTLVDGSLETYLATLGAGSVDAFCLSNIGEWLDDPQRARLFTAVARAAAPGAVVVVRNLVPRRDTVPAALQDVLVADPALTARAGATDHSLLRYQLLTCRRADR